MITINRLFRRGELNVWLYWKIDSLFEQDYPKISKLQENFFWWTVLYVFVYLLVSCWIHDLVCQGNHTNEHIPLLWPALFVLIPVSCYFFLRLFRRVKFMYHYNSFRNALSFGSFGFDKFLHEIDCDFKHAVHDRDGCVHRNLALQLKNGLLSVEMKFGDRAQETPEWIYYRNRFSRSFDILNRRFGLIAKPKEGWTPYMRLARE